MNPFAASLSFQPSSRRNLRNVLENLQQSLLDPTNTYPSGQVDASSSSHGHAESLIQAYPGTLSGPSSRDKSSSRLSEARQIRDPEPSFSLEVNYNGLQHNVRTSDEPTDCYQASSWKPRLALASPRGSLGRSCSSKSSSSSRSSYGGHETAMIGHVSDHPDHCPTRGFRRSLLNDQGQKQTRSKCKSHPKVSLCPLTPPPPGIEPVFAKEVLHHPYNLAIKQEHLLKSSLSTFCS